MGQFSPVLQLGGMANAVLCDDQIAVIVVAVDPDAVEPEPLGRNQRRAGTAERVEHRATRWSD